MPASKAKRAETSERRTKLIKLRLAGVSFEDPRVLALGYASRQAATKDLIRALEQRRDEEAAVASAYRQQENERLDELMAAVWERATTPTPQYSKDGIHTHDEIDLRAVDTLLRLMDRRAKLNGLDSPVRTEVSGPDGGAVPLGNGSLLELKTLIGIAGQTGPVDELAPAPDDDNEDAGDDGD
ncbi:hypothetical protein [Streptomyces sp. NPDC059916]|uniref:hypothetical protein n=1 Tax=Streptomyces sp. NPDC059916 TaxID=3347001 RepID=UPI00369E75E8